MRTRGSIYRFLVLLLTVVVLVNLVGQKLGFRWDLTDDDRYTLGNATQRILDDLPTAVTVTAYFTEDLPPDLERTKSAFHDLLVEYNQRSDGRVNFEFVDPSRDEALENEAVREGVRPVLVSVREKDKAEQLRAFMGAVVKHEEDKAVIPVVQDLEGMEWMLSRSIKQVSTTRKPTIGFVQGHGEPSMNAMPQALQELNALYHVEHFTFLDTLPVYDRFDMLVMLDPKDSIPPAHLHWMDDALARGKGLVVAYGPVASDLANEPVLRTRDVGLNTWLRRHGVEVGNTVMADASCGTVSIMQQRGQFSLQTPVSFPYFPLFAQPEGHPAVDGLDAVLLQFCTPLHPSGEGTGTYRPMLTTSPRSTELELPHVIDLQKPWTDADLAGPAQVVAATVEPENGAGGRLAVFTNGTFAVNGSGQRMQQLNPDNVNLLVNTIDWVSDRTGLIELRTKGTAYRPLRELGDGRRLTIKLMNLLLPILLVLGYGLLRWQWRRRQRRRRSVPGHVQ